VRVLVHECLDNIAHVVGLPIARVENERDARNHCHIELAKRAAQERLEKVGTVDFERLADLVIRSGSVKAGLTREIIAAALQPAQEPRTLSLVMPTIHLREG
jgi:hypothetical protein